MKGTNNVNYAYVAYTPIDKFMHDVIQLDGFDSPEYPRGPLVVP
jgi:hypothetical protein